MKAGKIKRDRRWTQKRDVGSRGDEYKTKDEEGIRTCRQTEEITDVQKTEKYDDTKYYAEKKRRLSNNTSVTGLVGAEEDLMKDGR